MGGYNLSHLKQLEAESIHIIREVAAEFDNGIEWIEIGTAGFALNSPRSGEGDYILVFTGGSRYGSLSLPQAGIESENLGHFRTPLLWLMSIL